MHEWFKRFMPVAIKSICDNFGDMFVIEHLFEGVVMKVRIQPHSYPLNSGFNL